MQYNRRYSNYKVFTSIKEIILKRYNILSVIMICLFIIIIGKLYTLQIIKEDMYLTQVTLLNERIIEGTSSPRGRIYDRNHNLLVDNKPIRTVYYKKPAKITQDEEVELAYQVASILDLSFSSLNERNLKDFWLVNNKDEANSRVTNEEWQKLKERRITLDDILKLKLERITDKDLNKYNDNDKKAAYIYYLMNKGYYFDEKTIKNKDVTEYEYAYISENAHKLPGFNTKLDWERVYLYGDTFKTILGNVSSERQGIPLELKDYYLNKGYSLSDRVGISYIERQYEDILRGKKAKYKLLSDNNYQLIEEGKRGNDIVLSIDIKLQQEIEKILAEEVLKTKKEPNTEYYNRSFVIITHPKTGEILAMSGKQVIKNNLDNDEGEYRIIDYTPGITTSPVVVGSVIKGASILLGYKENVIDIGTRMHDSCIKIKDTPIKCSWRNLGWINDIDALKFSSNIYQFKIAIAIGEGNYQYNGPLVINPIAFDKYRKFYEEFGLGIKTGIDLPVESTGYKGNSKLSGHLLDFAMGQYDNYTPIQLSQYINTIANGGYRLQPTLLKEVYESSIDEELGKVIYQQDPIILNKVSVDDVYIERVREGFQEVMRGIIGWGYMGNISKPAGKTGTSESFIDTTGDGIVDKATITNTFAGYAPYDNPIMSVVVVSPDVKHLDNRSSYRTIVNKRISSRVSQKFFEFYQ
ncbi:MAG: penicillin-binding protein 2 [Bacilli bacterium]|nr:penicillin-binding protein 2 [Bacilli bacterium]